MDYISNYGQSAGPIKINNTWITTVVDRANTKISETQAKPTYYMSFSGQKNYTDQSVLTPLLAGTPIFGSYTDKNGEHLCAPSNAVATVEWVRLYTANIDTGGVVFNPDEYVKQDQMTAALTRIVNAEAKILELTSRVSAAENTVNNMQSLVTTLNNTVTDHALTLQQHTADIAAIKTNPFPNGLWLVCGDSAH